MEKQLRNNLLSAAEAFGELTGRTPSAVSIAAAKSTTFFSRLKRDPAMTFTARKYDDVMDWFVKHWPDDKRPTFIAEHGDGGSRESET